MVIGGLGRLVGAAPAPGAAYSELLHDRLTLRGRQALKHLELLGGRRLRACSKRLHQHATQREHQRKDELQLAHAINTHTATRIYYAT